MPPLTVNQKKGKQCEEYYENILSKLCPLPLERLSKGADYKCGYDLYFEVKSGRSRLTPKQRETRRRVEERGGKYVVLRCRI